jgi:hypothetical protein
VITLGGTYTDVWVGLPYAWRYKSSKLAYAGGDGTAILQKKRISQVGVLLANTHKDAIRYGRNFTDTYPMPAIERGKIVADHTVHDVYDETSFPFGGEWDTDSRICLSGAAPYPATLLGVLVAVDTNVK